MGDRLTGVNRHQGCIIAATILLSIIFSWQAASHSYQPAPPTTPAEDNGARQLPARAIPVPTTVSPELQKAIAKPLGPNERFWSTAPKSTEEWRKLIAQTEKEGTEGVAQLLKRYAVNVQSQTVSGVERSLSCRSLFRKRIGTEFWSTSMAGPMFFMAAKPALGKLFWQLTSGR